MFLRIILFIALVASSGCTKEFLEPKSDKKMVVPSTLKDLQALLSYSAIMNGKMPHMGEVSSDDYYVTDNSWNNITKSSTFEKDGYVWSLDLFKGTGFVRDWTNGYNQIFYCNTVLDGLEKLKSDQNSAVFESLKGSALYFRASSFFQLSQLFCAPYVAGAENNGLGLPLPIIADINYRSTRSSVKETYQQMISDLEAAVLLLEPQSAHLTQPNKVAALSLLARIHLVMQNYEEALRYSIEATQMSSTSLMNFNEVLPGRFPMERYNQEVIHQSTLLESLILSNSKLLVDTLIYASYDDTDLRKKLWFIETGENAISYMGSYDGSSIFFNGIALSELYLIEAECLARLSRENEALTTLNSLLITRYETGQFIPIVNQTKENLILAILKERRKELIYRGVRWSDLRRLNVDPKTSKSLFRVLNGITYELKPNSLNYILPLPEDAVLLGKIEQNPRE